MMIVVLCICGCVSSRFFIFLVEIFLLLWLIWFLLWFLMIRLLFVVCCMWLLL